MSVKGRGDMDIEAGTLGANLGDEVGKIPLEMEADGQEVRNDQDSVSAASEQVGDGRGQVRLAAIEKRSCHQGEGGVSGDNASDISDGLIGGLD